MGDARREEMEEMAAWIKARLMEGATAQCIGEELSNRLDTTVCRAVEAAMGPELLGRLQVLAVGGYGRREMYPHGDVDLVLLYDDSGCGASDEPAERLSSAVPGGAEAVEALLTGLRDAGHRVGLRVRGRAEHLRLVAEDVTVAAASMDARVLTGATILEEPAEATVAAIASGFGGGADRFCQLILEGVRHRHAQFGGSAWLLEPQLKTGRGGLRDGHAIQWAARLRWNTERVDQLAEQGVVTTAEAEDYRASLDFVGRARFALHALSRWRNDRLAFERQEDVARLLGFGHGDGPAAIEGFMQAYYRYADQLANLCERWLQEWASVGTADDVQPLDDGFELRGGRLAFVQGEEELVRDIAHAARLLMRARHEGVHLHASARSYLRDVADDVDPRVGQNPDAVRVVRRALLGPEADAYMLRALLDTELFSRMVPEWRHIVGHTSHDVYHVFTTDRHLFEAFTRVAALVNGLCDDVPVFVADALERLQNAASSHVEALLLATLLHDVGKGLDGDHSLIGAGMVAEVGRRIGMTQDGRELARWLVLEHLRMVRISQRRDLSDPDTVQAFLTEVPTESHLNALTILSWADMISVGPALQSDWKLELLRQLAALSRASLAGRTPHVPRFRNRPAVIAALEDDHVDEDDVRWLENELSDRHWATFSEDELAHAIELLCTAREEKAPSLVRFLPDVSPGVGRLIVCTRDRPRLLWALTASIALERHNILRARIFTTRSGLALDHFDLAWVDPGGRPLGPHRRTRLIELLERVARDEVPEETLLARGAEESTLARPHRPPVATEVLCQPGDGHLLIEVKTRDRIGLLAELARRLSNLGFEIERSIIAREGDRAIDTFYVQRTPQARLGAEELRADLRDLLRRADERTEHTR